MLIDRTKFLLLAATIAASSCTVVEENDDEGSTDDTEVDASTDDTDDAPTDDAETDDEPTDDASTDDAPTEAGPGPSGDVDSGPSQPSSDAGDAAADAGSSDVDASPPDSDSGPSTPETDAGESDAGNTTDAAAMACLADEGTLPSCDELAVSSFDEFQRGHCEDAPRTMKPGVAAQFMGCILAQSAEELEDTTNTYACKLEAALAACEDEEAVATCEAFQGYCPEQEMDECLAHVNGLTPEGRADIVTCAESFCFGIYSCLEGL